MTKTSESPNKCSHSGSIRYARHNPGKVADWAESSSSALSGDLFRSGCTPWYAANANRPAIQSMSPESVRGFGIKTCAKSRIYGMSRESGFTPTCRGKGAVFDRFQLDCGKVDDVIDLLAELLEVLPSVASDGQSSQASC